MNRCFQIGRDRARRGRESVGAVVSSTGTGRPGLFPSSITDLAASRIAPRAGCPAARQGTLLVSVSTIEPY